MLDYDEWKTSTPSDYYPQITCCHCDDREEVIHEASGFLKEILKQAYSKENLDIHRFEHCLDMLCHLLKVPMNTGDIQISRTQVKKHQSLDLWFAHNQLNQIVQGAKP